MAKLKSKPKTQEQKDKDTNARLLRTYGIGLEEYNFRLEEQGNKCAICDKPPTVTRLAVDHDHKYKYLPIATQKEIIPGFKWYSCCFYRGLMFDSVSDKRNEAIQNVRLKLKVASVRGLICFPCNRLLRMAFDEPQRLANAFRYLVDFQTFTASAPNQ